MAPLIDVLIYVRTVNVALVGKLVPVSCYTHRERGVGGEVGAGELLYAP